MHDVNKSLSLTITSEGFVLYFRSFIWECTPMKRSFCFCFFYLCRIPLWTAPPLRINLSVLQLMRSEPASFAPVLPGWTCDPASHRPPPAVTVDCSRMGVWSQLAGWWEHSLGFWQSTETMSSFLWGNRVVRIVSRAAGGHPCYWMEKACLKMKLVQRK